MLQSLFSCPHIKLLLCDTRGCHSFCFAEDTSIIVWRLKAAIGSNVNYGKVGILQQFRAFHKAVVIQIIHRRSPDELLKHLTGLLALAEMLGVNPEDTIAIGDNLNDLSMIKAAGLGVGVANTVADMKPLCDCITSASCNENAVAEVINRFVTNI